MQPTILWRPTPCDLRHPEIQAFASLCDRIRTPSGTVPLSAFHQLDLGDLRRCLAIFEPVDGSHHFLCTFEGEELPATRGRTRVGLTTEVLAPHVSALISTLLGAASAVGHPVLTIFEPVQAVFARSRTILMQPLTGPDGSIAQIACLTVPDNDLRPGLDAIPDPVLVLRADKQVVYANCHAQALFGHRKFQMHAVSMEEYCGFDLQIEEREDARRTKIWETRIATLCDTLVVHFQVSVQQISFRQAPYFVVVARPA